MSHENDNFGQVVPDVHTSGDDHGQSLLMTENDTITVNQALEYIGVGRFQWYLSATCGLGWLADNAWIQVQNHFSHACLNPL